MIINSRKFYFILTIIITSFLFFSGIGLVYVYETSIKNINKNDFKKKDLVYNLVKPIIQESQPVNILLIGGDKVAKNADTMMLINFNPITTDMSIMSIPRDTRIHIKGSNLPKINTAYQVGGSDRCIETVCSLLNVKIKYYIYIDVNNLVEIIDNLDGVYYNVPANMDYDDPVQNLHIHLKKGYQLLDGKKSIQFLRFRKASKSNRDVRKIYNGSDLNREQAQQNFIKEFLRQKKDMKYIGRINSIINSILENLDTNVTVSGAIKLSQNAPNFKANEIKTFILPGNEASIKEGKYGVLSFYVPNINDTSKIINEHFKSDLP
ncbi:cell envelope-related transcriptional attenuator [Pseudobacteroides cellulosolvens ATCC 35603 = DSM 2933]|uniref:Cell envelope-related transcriptional attenuator n=2 Tax=Pseudobacteroides cellulosolvens TaxID=35825 RepID=A0A0L6JQT5_9FIRM|nr:cell envelope-related transcriptional attenuator [Pseudobacteroides cellulosolvens ATCC 35603 = DSM 2933]